MQKPQQFLSANPGLETVEAFVVDANGTLRGKSLPAKGIEKIFSSGLRLPRSAFAVDIWGRDVLAAGLVSETGDNDGLCRPVAGTLFPVPWASISAAQILLTMEDEKGAGFFGDPRQLLGKIIGLFTARGFVPVVAVELEFYLLDAVRNEKGFPQPPKSARTGQRIAGAQTYGIGEVAEFQAVLRDINQACKIQQVPADATISENGPGQFEINLDHVPDALLAADQAIFFKRIVTGVARKHGMDATFMAKPYGDMSGSGMHVHFSILDAAGENIFASKDNKGSDTLRHAIGGLMRHMPDSTAIFAPNLNSYRRFRKGSHAPTRVAWGYDNRSCALRVPESDIAATRIEHRVSGADANPYLALAVMLAAAYDGIDGKMDPGPALTGNAYESSAKSLPANWEDALLLFEKSPFIEKYLGADYKKVYLACKRQEKDMLDAEVTSAEYAAYLRDI